MATSRRSKKTRPSAKARSATRPAAPAKKAPKRRPRAPGGRGSAASAHARGRRPAAGESFPIVGVGASAGGLEAIERLLRALPSDTGLAFLLVVHLDPRHKSRLSEILSRATSMPVVEAADGMPVEPDHVFTIPSDRSLVLQGRLLRVEPREDAPAHFAPVDALLRSLALQEKNRAIGVILSGAGSDGAAGIREIKDAGGITFAQDSGSARYSSMPHAAVVSGGVDLVLPPEEIARYLGRLIHHPYVRLPAELEAHLPPREEGPVLGKLFQQLWKVFGVDFNLYKQSTVHRRVNRRLALRAVPTLADYMGYVAEHPEELRELYRDMFIGVTSFFREPDTFAALNKIVFPRIVKQRPPDRPIRIWVPGCSTGEEVYSIAIGFLEYVRRRRDPVPVQIFGTDINEDAIRKARRGRYLASVAPDVGQARLRFFIKTEDGYQVSKSVRDLCVFARHDVLRDPPFSRLDLISCRNLLIYLGGEVQQRLVPLFHYGLRPGGFLLLGSAESIDGSADLFDLVDRRARIYVRRTGVVLPRPDVGASASAPATGSDRPELPRARSEADLHRSAADLMVLNQYAPAAVLINEDEQILHFRGRTGPYIEPSPGSASLKLPSMVREGLLVGLRSALDTARKTGGPAEAPGLCVEDDERERVVDLRVVPVRAPDSASRTYLVLFDAARTEMGHGRPAAGPAAAVKLVSRSRVVQLKEELAANKAFLQSVIESQEAGSEELRATNEELLSTNEELQSTTEELETANEELQSANEELVTLNEELGHRNRELSQAHSDILNLLAGMRLSIVIVDRDQRIRQLTPSADDMLGLGPGDVGRALRDVRLRIDIPALDRLLRESITRQEDFETEVQDQNGRWYSLQIRPYLTAENAVEGTVMILGDIHRSKQVEESLRMALRHAPAVLFTQDRDLRYTWVFNPLPPLTHAALLGRTDGDIFQASDARRLTAIKQRVLRTGAGVREVVRVTADGEQQWFDMTVEPLADGEGRTVGVTCASWNVTAQTEALVEQRRLAIVEERHRVAGDLHDGLAQGLSAIVLQLEGAEQVLEDDAAEARRQIARARELARENLEETRRVLQALGPRFLDSGDLPGALRLLVDHVQVPTEAPVEVSVRGRPRRLAPEVEENLLRVAQEALGNALRHAKASRVVAGLAYRADLVRLQVEDDGAGFRPKEPRPPSCLGLAILEERARRIGAKLSVRSAPGRGTCIEVTLQTRRRRRSPR